MTEEQFKALCLEYGIAFICLHQANGVFIQLSPSCKRITGYNPEELIGKNPYDFFHPDDKETIETDSHLPLLELKESTTTIEYRFRKKEGQYLWLRTTTHILKNKEGEVEYLLSVSEDITEVRKKQELLGKEEVLLEEAGNMAKIGAWEVDLETNAVIWNKVTYDIHELDYNTPIDLTSAINYYTVEDRPKVEKLINEALATGRQWDFKHRLITAKNNKRWVRAIGRPIIQNGKTVKLFGTFQDITAEVEAEKAQKELIEQLSMQKKQLVEFNQIVSHNLRSPVSSLTALLLILERVDSADERNEIINNIKEVNRSLNTLLDELVDAVKIINDTDIEQEEIDVEEVVKQTKKILDGNIKQLNAKINFDNAAWQKIKFPKLYFESIVLNLMSNALKYHSAERDLQIDIALSLEDGKKTLLFSDNGLGINLNRYADKIFKMHKTFHRDKQGKGLGLFMTKNQVEAMGGTISVESEEGKGSTFKISFKEDRKK